MSPRSATGWGTSTRSASFVLLSAAGCTQILGLHDRLVGTSDSGAQVSAEAVPGQCGGLEHPSASCASCMDQSCCSEARSCAGDAACREASDCLAGCADDDCRARCTAFHALPATLMALRACRIHHCAPACASACGEFVSPLADCETCERGSCCAPGAACAADADCAALNLCIANCFGSPSCPNECQAKYPLGASDFQTWSACTASCASACQPGQSWACLVSPIVWPKPPAVGTITFSITFVDFSAEEPFVGATVKACDKLDYVCSAPRAQSTTDATGVVTLTVPAGLNGFDGYLDISGGTVASTGAAAVPTVWYPVPFVVADGWRGKTQILNADEFAALTGATGVTLDPARGHFAINAADCAFGSAAGVSFSIDIADAQTVSYYLVGGVPVTTATATDQSGIGAFLNLPTNGPTRLAVVRAFAGTAGGKSMGALSFVVRPGTLTTGSSFPPVP